MLISLCTGHSSECCRPWGCAVLQGWGCHQCCAAQPGTVCAGNMCCGLCFWPASPGAHPALCTHRELGWVLRNSQVTSRGYCHQVINPAALTLLEMEDAKRRWDATKKVLHCYSCLQCLLNLLVQKQMNVKHWHTFGKHPSEYKQYFFIN